MKLTKCEQEIILEITKGYDKHSLIAQKLGISPSTFNAHLSNIYRKTNTHNQVQLIRWAWLEAARCRRDENAAPYGLDNGREFLTAQAIEPLYGDGGKIHGKA